MILSDSNQDPNSNFKATLQMEPSHGCLEPESEKEVKLIFKADLESSYNVVLSINIPGVGKSILQAKSL